MKKNLLLFLAVVGLCCSMCACGEKKEPTSGSGENEIVTPVDSGEGEENQGEYVIPAATEELYQKLRVKYNGVEFGVKDQFDDIKDKLGSETRPPQTYTPCAALVAGDVTTHYYEGLTLETNDKGVIYSIKFSSFDNPNSTAELTTGVKLGSSHDDVINGYGDSDSDDEYNTSYSYDKLYFAFSYDVDGDGTVNYFSLESEV